MDQPNFLYSHGSVVIATVLFLLIVLANEFGFRVGRFIQGKTDSEVRSLTGSIQASILGLLALLLGFTFSMSMQRYDSRSHALIDEANAIGTTVLRAELLPEAYRGEVSALLRRYVEMRIEIGKIDLSNRDQRQEFNGEITDIQRSLWTAATAATQEDPRPVTTGAFVAALNAMIDSQGKRNALLHMQVPEAVLLLLFVVFITSGGILGYSSGLSGRRITVPTVLVSFLIVLIVFIIIDLDRPKRGLIQVDQRPMLQLLDEAPR